MTRRGVVGATLIVVAAMAAIGLRYAPEDEPQAPPARGSATAAPAAAASSPSSIRDDGPVLPTPPRPTAPGRTAYITVTQPSTLAVGETADVAIAVDAPREVRTISFRVKLDPDVAQLRDVAEGDWTTGTGLPATFSADLEPDESGARLRATLPRPASIDRRADVATLRMQAIAPGKCVIGLSDLQATDSDGRPLAIAPSTALAVVVRVESTLPGRS